jgi:hypothetical protein
MSQENLNRARAKYTLAQQSASRGDAKGARLGFSQAAKLASGIWRQPEAGQEMISEAARLSADAMWSACMAHLSSQGAQAADTLRAATLLGAEIYEADHLEEDVRLHGLYRAQCATLELAHVRLEAKAQEDAIELLRDVAECAQAAKQMSAEQVDAQKVARVLANASAAMLTLGQVLRDGGSQKYREELNRSVEYGRAAVESEALPGPMAAESMLVVAESFYEIALLVEDPEKIGTHLESALGWTRLAAQAPGADGSLQAEAWHRGANYACVYGLFKRHEDFEEGLSFLEGAVELALEAARLEHLPAELRAQSYETAVRTCQNMGLLHKERKEWEQAQASFARSVELATEAAHAPGLATTFEVGFWYLSANGSLEQAVIWQHRQEAPSPQAEALLRQAHGSAQKVLQKPGAPAQVVARAALLASGAVGRLMQTLAPGDEAGIIKSLEAIEVLGQRAAEAEGADLESRSRGAFFAADAAEKMAQRLKDPRAVAEARQRATWLHDLSRRLKLRMPG